MAASSLLRIALVQFAPKIGEVQANLSKARELCQRLTPRSVDLVCLPEMIFTGYMFPDAPSIAPYLEHPKTGPTATFCADLAKRLECFVAAGFPERLEATSPDVPDADSGSVLEKTQPRAVGANAGLLYSPTGDLLHVHHKSNLFPLDLPWARPGPGFTTLDLPPPLGRTTMAICNDMNVHSNGEWISLEGGPYELAEWCRRERVRTLVLLNAWLKPENEGGKGGASERAGGVAGRGDGDGNGNEDGLEPNWSVLNFWSMRLRPLWALDEGGSQVDGSQEPVVVVVSNRFGEERGKTFCGSSAVLTMRPGSGRPRLIHAMGEREEGVQVSVVKD